MRKTKYSKEMKAKVAIEALKGEKTIQDLAQIYKVHPNMITQWKKLLTEGAAEVFDRKKKVSVETENEKKMDALYNQIGVLQVEKEFLKKKYRQIYGTEPEL